MAKNVGRLDQILRTGIGLGLVYAGFFNNEIINDSLSSNIIGTIGLINLIVALTRFCPFYTFTSINTCVENKNESLEK